jgi:hypothetical protein
MSLVLNQQLMNAISFTDKDLALNRQLKLSERQKRRLKPGVDSNFALSAFLMIGCFFFAGATLLRGSESLFSFILSMFGVVSFGLTFYWAFRSLQWTKELENYAGVKFVEGTAIFDISYKRTSQYQSTVADIPVYSMTVGDVKLYLDETTYDSITGTEFRIYYFQTLKKKILSIETLG